MHAVDADRADRAARRHHDLIGRARDPVGGARRGGVDMRDDRLVPRAPKIMLDSSSDR
jgi:hypothetical protein